MLFSFNCIFWVGIVGVGIGVGGNFWGFLFEEFVEVVCFYFVLEKYM